MEKQQEKIELTYFYEQIRKINADFAQIKDLTGDHRLNIQVLHSLMATMIESLTDEQKAQINPALTRSVIALSKQLFAKTEKSYQDAYKSYCESKKNNKAEL